MAWAMNNSSCSDAWIVRAELRFRSDYRDGKRKAVAHE
jgi:hypothetical protein